MRVLFVINSLGASGAEHSTATLLPLLRDRGHEVAVATLYDAGFGDEERIRADGFDVRPLVETHLLGRVRELRRRIREFRPDVVHTALFDADLIGRLAAARTGARTVSSLVNTPYSTSRLLDPGVKTWKVRLLQLLDAVTAHWFVDRFHAVSSGVATSNAGALRLDMSRIVVAERGRSRDVLGQPSHERRARVRSSLGLADDVRMVLAVGRQEHQKNHVDLVRAVDQLVDRVPGLVVLIAGRPGNASEALQQCLAEHPRGARVITLLGHRHDVPDLLCAADVLAIPSLYEGTAGAAIEAMALHCPVVCADLDGVKGILHDGVNALLVPSRSPTALACALARVLDDTSLADGLRRRGLTTFEERFTAERAADRLEALYADAVGALRLQVNP